MKATIKKLAKDIDYVLEQNAICNEMSALIDCGEWSGTGPDFTDLIKRWKLDRATLLTYVDIAYKHAKRFDELFPKIEKYAHQGWWPQVPTNPWKEIYQTLNCIFIAGELQE